VRGLPDRVASRRRFRWSTLLLVVCGVIGAVGIVAEVDHLTRTSGTGRAGSKSATSSVRVDTFRTLPSGKAGLPHTDDSCAAKVPASKSEPRPTNATANHSVPTNPSAAPWANNRDNTYWTKWIANRSKVTGNYTGNTDMILRWAACKWGLNENVLRAVAVEESDWKQGTAGDVAHGRPHSFGLMQIRNTANDGGPAWGGYPASIEHTALNVDFYGAYLRSCLDGDFYDRGPWLYHGQTIRQVIAAHGFSYALWGCVGSWFSGNWYDAEARPYIARVRNHLAAEDWPGEAK
jgi:hypothetical protein